MSKERTSSTAREFLEAWADDGIPARAKVRLKCDSEGYWRVRVDVREPADERNRSYRVTSLGYTGDGAVDRAYANAIQRLDQAGFRVV